MGGRCHSWSSEPEAGGPEEEEEEEEEATGEGEGEVVVVVGGAIPGLYS